MIVDRAVRGEDIAQTPPALLRRADAGRLRRSGGTEGSTLLARIAARLKGFSQLFD
jgi:hypothetical protein